MQVYLIRHGQSLNNAMMEDQLKRVQDPELTDIGKQQAQLLADYFLSAREKIAAQDPKQLPLATAFRENLFGDINKLYCSAMHRALQTAQPLATALKMQTHVWLDIHEQGGIYLEKEGVFTGFGGRTRSQITQEFPDYMLPDLVTEDGWWLPNDGYEDYGKSIGRAVRVADTLKKWATEDETAEDRVGLVSHGTFIDTLIKALTGNLPGSPFYYNHWNTAVTRIDFTKDQREMRIRYINRVDHLPAELVTW